MKLKRLYEGDFRTVLVRGKLAMAVGLDSTIVIRTKISRRKSKETAWGLFDIDDTVYATGSHIFATRDFGKSWRKLAMPAQVVYLYVLRKDPDGMFWLGTSNGKLFRTKQPSKKWTLVLTAAGKIRDLRWIDGRLLVIGAGIQAWDQAELSTVIPMGDELKSVLESPSGTLIAIGDGGITYRSTDRGVKWKRIKTVTNFSLDDGAWIGDTLYVVGGTWNSDGILLRSDDDGKTYRRVTGAKERLCAIAAYGKGALIASIDGVYKFTP